MEARSHILSPSVARGIAVMCAAVFVASAHTAQAGINVWTSHGPPGGDVHALAIDPLTPRTLYAAGSGGVFKSTDAGATWNAANAGLPNTNDIYALAIDPSTPRTLYARNFDGGVLKSTDGASSWQAVNAGLPGTGGYSAEYYVRVLAIDPTTPRTLYAGTNVGVFKTTDAGNTWSAAETGLPAAVSALAIDPTTAGTLYAGTIDEYSRSAVFKSTDGAGSWQAVGQPEGYFFNAFAIDPSTPSTLYAAANGGVFKSTDGANSWTPANTGLPDLPDNPIVVTALAIDSTTPRTLYAGTSYDGVFKSTDGGSTWNALNTGLTNTGFSSGVQALVIDPLEPRRVYAGTSGGVFAIEQISACIGDCDGSGSVTVDDLITLVNIALDTAPPAACPNGLPSGTAVDVAWIIQAVSSARDGCGVGA
jgi:photosystem II stability/assembly factor-like uncharacterized protein